MHLWPLQPPQGFEIPDRAFGTGEETCEDHVLQSLIVPHTNCMVVLTSTRVLIYNHKPPALISTHERSLQSITDFGANRFVVSDTSSLEDPKSDSGELRHQGEGGRSKANFYVITDKNVILVYQLLLSASRFSVFKEVGIPVLDLNNITAENGQDFLDDDEDDEILTVFDKTDSNKLIQNGFSIEKQRGFLHLFNKNSETIDEVPIRKVELRLKIILRFDYEITDVRGFYEPANDENEEEAEFLVILFAHGLQSLNLKSFKMNESSVINVKDGVAIVPINDTLCVVSQKESLLHINYVSIADRKVKTTELNYDANEKLMNAFALGTMIGLAFQHRIAYFSVMTEDIIVAHSVGAPIKVCKPLNEDTFLVLQEDGELHAISKWGNVLFSLFNSEYNENEKMSYSRAQDFAVLDKTLAIVTESGWYLRCELWQECWNDFTDFRNSRPFILHNDNNDIVIFSKPPELDSSVVSQSIRLPTKTLNNYVPLIKVNGCVSRLAAYVANKNILLLHSMEHNTWQSFTDMSVIDMHWIADDYLLIASTEDDNSQMLKCYAMTSNDESISDLRDASIWEYQISDSSISSVHVNTLSRFRLLKVKSKTSTAVNLDTFFKTAEIILICENKRLQVIDVISSISQNGHIGLRRFHALPVTMVAHRFTENLKGIFSYADGFFAYEGDVVLKIKRAEDKGYEEEAILEGVEKIIDLVAEEIYLVQKGNFIAFSLPDLWTSGDCSASSAILEDGYPAAVSPGAKIVHSVQCVNRERFSKLIMHQNIFLDQIILSAFKHNIASKEIDEKYRTLKHYKFALEKILSVTILDNKPLDSIVALIDCYDKGPVKVGKLEIISNCLRKIEVEHWESLFQGLSLTPKSLLVMCVEQNQAKALGILLMVFLSYDDNQLNNSVPLKLDSPSAPISKGKKKNKNKKKASTRSSAPRSPESDPGFAKVLNDENLIIQVLQILVTAASTAKTADEARDYWDLSFQLVRFMQALDAENKSDLVNRSLQLIQ
ncbi:LAMI_0G16248g1_1 [Lachancea mirantina]|uniref:LAMI_0G16248g1_1 n=1 Tax=Lachancea mirantina TaxID=1230905 RepID=A0A1G4KCJ4_9SACH|nr:LAMI_0G16248g1_1 [Lachancea mirantina]